MAKRTKNTKKIAAIHFKVAARNFPVAKSHRAELIEKMKAKINERKSTEA